MGDVALQMNASMHTFQMHSFGAQIQPEHGPLVICSGTNQQKAEAVKVVDTDIPSMQFNGLWRERWTTLTSTWLCRRIGLCCLKPCQVNQNSISFQSWESQAGEPLPVTLSFPHAQSDLAPLNITHITP